MKSKLSRRAVAEYVASKVVDGKIPSDVINQLAAYIVESGRSRELQLIVRAVNDALEARGLVVASVASAHPLSDEVLTELQELIGEKQLFLRSDVNPDLIGGFRLDTPSAYLDTTIAHQLTLLAKAKQ